jgi:hypothetical protein
MWFVDLLQKSIPHFTADTHDQKGIDVERIRDIRVRLLKHITTRPDEIARTGDDQLVDALCVLRLELDALSATHPLRATIEAQNAIENIYAAVDRLLGTDIPFRETATLDSALKQLAEIAGKQSTAREGRKRLVRGLALIVTVLPLVGYGVHWSIAHFYRQALIEEVDIVYPQNTFEFTNDQYRLKDDVRSSALRNFRDYYFRDTVFWAGGFNPLPLAFRAEKAEDLGIELPPEIKARIEGGVMSERDLNTNLFMYRAFVRNLKDGNIVNHLRVRAVRDSSEAFPWNEMDIDTELRFTSTSDAITGKPAVTVRTTRTPVLNLKFDMRLQSDSGVIGQEFEERADMLTRSHWITPDFGTALLGTEPGRPVLVRLSPDQAATLSLSRAQRRTPEQAIRDFERDDTLFPEDGYIYFACPDGGVAVFGEAQTVQNRVGLKAANAIEIAYSYELLDGAERSGQERLKLEEPVLILEEGISVDLEEIEQCAQEFAYFMFGYAEAAAGPAGWLGALDKFALMLADRPKQKAPVIAVEQTMLFDFDGQLDELEQGSSQIHILKDGEYVLFTIIATNFKGGDYRFEFHFDDERVAEFTTVLEWPESLLFEKEDVALFRPVADEVATTEK